MAWILLEDVIDSLGSLQILNVINSLTECYFFKNLGWNMYQAKIFFHLRIFYSCLLVIKIECVHIF